MLFTIFPALLLMAAYFLILFAGVAFIQDKRFFSSAPKEVLAVVPEHQERFRGAHAVGWGIAVLAILIALGAIALAVWDGVKTGFGFWRFFARIAAMLYLTELYDIFFFDWFLLCRSNFFAHYYPEVKGKAGPQQFGYNKMTHLLHFVLYLPASAAAALLCTLL